MIHRLVGQPVACQGVKPADTGEQRPVFFPPDIIDPQPESLPGARRHVGQPLLVSLAQHTERPFLSDYVTQIQPHRLRTAKAASENDRQHRRIAHPDAGVIGLTGCKQRTDLRRRQGPAARKTAAAKVAHRPDMLEVLHVHQPEHPGFLRHALECRKVGVDGGGGPAGVAQQLGHGHHVMAPQAAPAAGLQRGGAKHAGDDAEERGHGLTAAGGVEGQQVRPGRADRSILTGQRRQEFLAGRKDRCGETQLRFVVGHQDHVGLRQGRKASGALREKSR